VHHDEVERELNTLQSKLRTEEFDLSRNRRRMEEELERSMDRKGELEEAHTLAREEERQRQLADKVGALLLLWCSLILFVVLGQAEITRLREQHSNDQAYLTETREFVDKELARMAELESLLDKAALPQDPKPCLPLTLVGRLTMRRPSSERSSTLCDANSPTRKMSLQGEAYH
jgi:hypothetical protein